MHQADTRPQTGARALLVVVLSWSVLTAVAAESPAQDRRQQAAVEGALRWLAAQQTTAGDEAGSWDAPKPEYRPAVASLAGLAFLANGHLPNEGEHRETVTRALGYVMASMAPDGYLGQGDRSGMYIHAMASLFGLSCLGMTGDPELEPELADWCRQAVDLVIAAQQANRPESSRGGWRYTPYTEESDVSVTSWQLLVLHAARQCGYSIDPLVFDNASRYLDRAIRQLNEAEMGYLYRPGYSKEPEPAITGAMLYVRSLSGRPDPEATERTLAYLADYPPAWGGEQYGQYFFFAGFYLTQGMFQVGGEKWAAYRQALREILVERQAGDGRWLFPPDNAPQSRLAGPAYPTAMAILMLSLERQYLPMYQRQKRLY